MAIHRKVLEFACFVHVAYGSSIICSFLAVVCVIQHTVLPFYLARSAGLECYFGRESL